LGQETRPRALMLLREMIMNKYVRSNKEKMAQGAATVEERAARELGVEAHYGQEELEQRVAGTPKFRHLFYEFD